MPFGIRRTLRHLLCALMIICSPAFCLSVAFPGEVEVVTVDPEVIPIEVHDRSDILFRRLSLTQGLSQTRVAQIVQDDEGYIWFGTQHGVSRYDGYGYHVFKHVREDPASLSGIFIYALFKDRDGTIWVGSDQYLDAFDRTTGGFRHYVVDPAQPTVIHISQDRDGLLWLSTSLGLFSLDPKTGATRKFVHDPADPHSLMTSDIKSTGEDRAGTFWVANGFGLEAFDRATGRVTMRVPIRQEVREFSFHEDAHGVFWIVYGSGNGIAILDRQAKILRRYSFDGGPPDSGLSGVYAVLEASNGDIWFATMGSGLLRFDRQTLSLDRYRNDPSDPQSLAENRAIALYEDREGNIWTGLHASPPNMFPRDRPPFRKLWPFPGHPNKLGETLVNTVFEDRDGYVWIGAGGALNRISPDGREMATIGPVGPDTPVEVLTISQDKSGTLWIGTLGMGLFAHDPRTGAFKSYRFEPNRSDWLSSDIVTRIHIDQAGQLWLSTWNGLSKFDPRTERFANYEWDQAPNAAFFSIVPDDRGNLWLGSTQGLVRFDLASSTFEVLKHDPDDMTSLSNNTVNAIFIDRNGTLWVGTQNGLNRMRPDQRSFDAFFDQDGLAGNAVSCILGNGGRHLWMSTNRGISRMSLDDTTFETFTSLDGLPGEDLTGWNACERSKTGALYFGGFSGAAVMEREDDDHPLFSAPPVVFTDIEVADRPLVLAADAAGREVKVPHDASLGVAFAALSFRDPESTRYRYRLEGLDNNWHAVASATRSINYPYLPPGSYTLLIEAASARGPWNEPGASLRVRVLPPWWATWWSYSLGALALASLLIIAYRARVARVQKQYAIRLEERLGERSRLAREFHDTLLQSFQGLIFRLQAVRDLLPGRPAEAAELLDVVLEKGDAAIAEGRDAVQALRDPQKLDIDILAALKAEGEELSRLKGKDGPTFVFTVEGTARALEPSIRQEVVRICSEALRNAFSHSGADRIECLCTFSGEDVRIIVRDNGKGMANGKRGRPGHFGISGMRERAERIGAQLLLESVDNLGTKVELRIDTRSNWSLWSTLRKARRSIFFNLM